MSDNSHQTQTQPADQVRSKQMVFNMDSFGEGTHIWAHYPVGSAEIFSATEIDRLNPQETYLIIPGKTIQDVKVIQSVDHALCLSLGLTDYSPLTDRLAETCHYGTYQSKGATFLVVIQKQLLSHMINMGYTTCQKIHHKTPTGFSIRVSSQRDERFMTTNTPEDTTGYIEVDNFREYLGDKHVGEEEFQVGLYTNNDQSRCLGQVTSYESVGQTPPE